MNRYTLAVVTVVLGCAMLQPARAEVVQPGAVRSVLAANCQLAADYSARHKGRAVLILVDGEVVCERYDNGNTAAGATHLHSATKSFWGVAVAAMVEDGLASSFDEPVADTITEWRGDSRKSRITVRQLLSVSSGLKPSNPQRDPLRDPETRDKYTYATRLDTVQEPGRRFSYGPQHYYVLGEWMRRKLAARGQSPVAYLQARILAPVGARAEYWEHDPSGNPNMPNGAHFTARDWSRFGQLLLQRGVWEGQQIVDEDLLEQCFSGSPTNPGYGLTFWLNRPGGRGPQTLSHLQSRPGDPGGFIFPEGYPDLYMAAGAGKNLLYVIPSLNTVIVRQAEGEQIRGYSDVEFLTRLFAGSPPEQSAATEKTDPSHLGSIEARAVWLVTRFDTDGDLMLSRRELPEQMIRLHQQFDRLDADDDGRLSAEELARIRGQGPRSGSGARRERPAGAAADASGREASDASRSEDVIRVSPPGESYFDPEILGRDNKVTFQYRDQIWVGELDPEDGTFLSGTGRDFLMDTGAERLGETFNGPEFGLDARGWAVFYAKRHAGTVQIWRAALDGDTARAQPLTSGQRHQTQLASKHTGAGSTRLLTIRGTWRDGEAVWLDDDDPSNEHLFDMVETGVISVRWIDSTHQFTFSQRHGAGSGQLSIFDTETGIRRTLTRDAGDKTDPYGWIAPDHDDQILVLAVVDDRAVAVYKDTGVDYWERIATLTIPSASRNRVVGSAEPFVVGGRSYVSLTIKSDKARIGRFDDGEVWIMGIGEDPKDRLVRRCDGGDRPVARFDPEVFVGREEAFVYYSVLTEERTFEVRRCRSGITVR